MQKLQILFFIFVVFLLISCASKNIDSENQYETVIIKSENATTEFIINNNMIQSAKHSDENTGLVTDYQYHYDKNNNLTFTDMEDSVGRSSTTYYGSITPNTSRSPSVAGEIVPNATRTITEQSGFNGRSTDTSSYHVEYYYNDDGSVKGILYKDSDGNITFMDMEDDDE